jgi:iron(III) transport system permease protein
MVATSVQPARSLERPTLDALAQWSGWAPLRRLARSPLVRFAPLFTALGVLLVWPLAMLVLGSFRTAAPGFPGDWTLNAWREAFVGEGTGLAIRNSFLISGVTTACATVFAAGLAFLSERTDAPLRRWITPALLVMFATPGLFYAMGYALLGNAYTGLANRLIQLITGTAWAPLDIETWPGLLAVMTLKKVSVIYLFLIGPFRALDPSHDEASAVAGASPFTTFLRIDLPILAPALTGAILLGVVTGLQAFDMIVILGWPNDIQVITTRVFEFVNLSATPEYAQASALSLGLLGVIAALTLVQARVLGSRSFFTVTGKARDARRLPLGRWGPVFGVLIGAYLLFAAALPIGSVAFSSIQRFPGVYDNLSFASYVEVLQIPRILIALRTTLLLSLVAGLAAMVLAVLAVQAGRSAGPRAAAAIRFTTFIPLAMPGVVTALAVAWAFLSAPGLQQLYGTVYLVGVAMIACVIPFAMQAASAAVAQISPELQEAARISGASGARALFDVVLRLIAPSFLIGWFMAAVLVSGNLEVPLLLNAPGQQPIAAVIYDLNARGDFTSACALLLLLLLVKAAVGFAGYGLIKGLAGAVRFKNRPAVQTPRPA